MAILCRAPGCLDTGNTRTQRLHRAGPPASTDLIITIHQLQSSAGLLLLHVAQSTLQAEHHVLILLYDLQGRRTPEVLRVIETLLCRDVRLGGATQSGEGSEEQIREGLSLTSIVQAKWHPGLKNTGN